MKGVRFLQYSFENSCMLILGGTFWWTKLYLSLSYSDKDAASYFQYINENRNGTSFRVMQ